MIRRLLQLLFVFSTALLALPASATAIVDVAAV
jgi:hypothetical protein